MASENLIRDSWRGLDQADLRVLLIERIGAPGQYDGDDTDVLYLPLAREECRVVLRYNGTRISSIEPGPAFDRILWNAICQEMQSAVLNGPQKVGRDFSFNTHIVKGSWRGSKSGVQILPPPDTAPIAGEGGENPFLLEFPVQMSGIFPLDNCRRIREHRKLTLVLNLLLVGTTSLLPSRRRRFWTGGDAGMRWVQEWYYADSGKIFIDELSPQSESKLEVITAENIYGIGLDGRGMRVPDDLDDCLYHYQHLSPALKAKFDRATYWMSMASRQWADSMSASFASLVSAAESLTGESIKHPVYCEECAREWSHDVPGATQKFHDFFERYAPDPGLRKQRVQMYALRSKILHGGELMQLDQDRAFGWDPPWWNERELTEQLWKLTQTAARNWLKAQPVLEYFRVVRHTLDNEGELAERAVLSGQHRTLNAALAALELETTKNPAWRFNPETNQWRLGATAGRSQVLMIDPF